MHQSRGLHDSTTVSEYKQISILHIHVHETEPRESNTTRPPPNIAEEDILEELTAKNLPIISVRQLKKTQVDPDTAIRTKVPLSIWLLTLRNEAGAKENIQQIKGILNLAIKIEEYKGSATPMQ